MPQTQQETQQESLLSLSSVLVTEFDSLNNLSISTSQPNSYKPTLVKQMNKEQLAMQTKENQDITDTRNNNTNNSIQSFRNRPNRNTSNFNNRPDFNNSTNTNNNTNNSNSNGFNDLDRSIDIVSSTYARIEKVCSDVEKEFPYKPSLGLVINAMIETGRFDAQEVADNICIVFGEKEGRNTRRSAIHLSDSNLEKCRKVQSRVKEILEMDIDLHPVINSMVYKGQFNPTTIAKAIRKTFLEKRKAAIEKSKTIN